MISAIISGLIIINKIFTDCNYEVHLVGGCVRDICMGRQPKDYDLTTNATPDEIIKVCDSNNIEYIPTGLKHGTVSIKINDILYEMTTYRIDGDYSDNRHPTNVTFSNSLYEDLARRDFTINAMAVSLHDFLNSYCTIKPLKNHIIDPFNGLEDIKNKTIKAIGNAHERFNEDGLRILRAIRFAIKYDFVIESNTMKAIFECHNLLDNISVERIQSEFNQMLMHFNKDDYCFNMTHKMQYKYKLMSFVVKKIFIEMNQLSQITHNSSYHLFDIFTHSMMVCFNVENTLCLKLAALFHDIGKMKCKSYDEEKLTNHFYNHNLYSVVLAEKMLKRLKYSNEIINNTLCLIMYHDHELRPNKKSIKRLLNKIEENQFCNLLDLKLADRLNHLGVGTVEEEIEHFNSIKDMYYEIKESQEVFSVKNLAINGNDLIYKLGIEQGPIIGELLNNCVEYCIDNPENNTKDILLNYCKNFLKNE